MMHSHHKGSFILTESKNRDMLLHSRACRLNQINLASMALAATQQILETLKRSSRPLICVPENICPDAYATALGLRLALQKLNKEPTIVASGGPANHALRFLSGHDQILSTLENLQKFVLELDVRQTRVDELAYEIKDDRLMIHLSPKTGVWKDTDLKINASAYRYDLILTVGAADLESLGAPFVNHPDFFFKTPIINLDHSPANEHFGQINVVDLTAAACGEIAYEMINNLDPQLLDADIATAFLTGLIAKTKSFKSKNLSPKSLLTASRLIARGATREIIVDHLYRTRSVPTLRLWGRALARLKSSADWPLVWTLLSRQDFMQAGAEEEELPDVIQELISASPAARLALLLYENREDGVSGLLRAEAPLDAVALAAPFKPSGTRELVRLHLPRKNIVQAEKEILKHLDNELRQLPI